MKIVVWGTDNCKVCSDCKKKLDEWFKISYETRDIKDIIEGNVDRNTPGILDLMVALQMNDGKYPIVQIDDKYFTYPEAMHELKVLKRENKTI